MVHIGLTADFGRQLFQWDGATENMKEPRNLIGQFDLTKREMPELVMQTAEPDSTQESIQLMIKILDSTYVKADLKQVANNTSQMNAEERTVLLSLLKDFEELVYGNLGDWSTEPVNLEINPYSKPFNSRYYPVPRINKNVFSKGAESPSTNKSTNTSTAEPIRHACIYYL